MRESAEVEEEDIEKTTKLSNAWGNLATVEWKTAVKKKVLAHAENLR